MDWHSALKRCKAEEGLSDHEIGEITGTSHTQVRRWREQEATPTGPQEAIIVALTEWLQRDSSVGGKSYLIGIVRKRGHREALETIFCET
jgi:transcriptional regulator with XRE-family HTH domain